MGPNGPCTGGPAETNTEWLAQLSSVGPMAISPHAICIPQAAHRPSNLKGPSNAVFTEIGLLKSHRGAADFRFPDRLGWAIRRQDLVAGSHDAGEDLGPIHIVSCLGPARKASPAPGTSCHRRPNPNENPRPFPSCSSKSSCPNIIATIDAMGFVRKDIVEQIVAGWVVTVVYRLSKDNQPQAL